MSIYKGIVNINSVTGSPVGVIIAEKINTVTNISFLLSVKIFLLMMPLLIKKYITNGVWNEIPNKIEILEISWK